MKKIILIGGGGHCNSCIDVIETEKKFSIKGIILPKKDFKFIIKYPVIGTDKDLLNLIKITPNVLICIGQIKKPQPRKKIFDFLKKGGAKFPVIKSPYSYSSNHSIINEGTIVMHGSVINVNSKIGYNCIINSKSLIEHDVKIGNHCHISTGAIINGGVSIGEGSFIGSGSVIREGVKIGKHSIIGSGKVILKDIKDRTVIK